MAEFSIQEAILAGPRLLLREPLACLIWALIAILFLVVIAAPFASPLAEAARALMALRGLPTAEAVAPILEDVAPFYVLLSLGGLVVGAVIETAVYRAMLEPQSGGLAFLRLGGDELWVLLVNAAVAATTTAFQLALTLPLSLMVGIGKIGFPALTGPLLQIGQWAVDAAVFWLSLRFALAGPMAFKTRSFAFMPAWRLTRGRALRFLVIGASVALGAAAIYALAVLASVALAVGLWKSGFAATDLSALLRQPIGVWAPRLAPILATMLVALTLVLAILIPVLIAPWAYVYGRLAGGASLRPRV